MKKKTSVIAAGLVLLIGVIIVWLKGGTSPHFIGGFSPEDFKDIQKVIRQSMWRGAFPNFSTRTLAATPGSLWCLATSRIEQVNVFPGGTHCVVYVRSPQGIALFDVQKSRQTIWQIGSQGLVGKGLINKLENIRGFAKFRVEGGVGLHGGKLPPVFYTPAVYDDQFERRRLLLPDEPQATTTRPEVTLKEGQFSGSLSNRAKLDLRPARPLASP